MESTKLWTLPCDIAAMLATLIDLENARDLFGPRLDNYWVLVVADKKRGTFQKHVPELIVTTSHRTYSVL